MNLVTTSVRALLYQPDGTPFAGCSVTAILTEQEIDGGLLIPHEITVTTDTSGTAMLLLWPNSRGATGSQYKIQVRQGSTLIWRGAITVPEVEGIVDMHTLVQIQPYPAIDAAALAVLQAQGYSAQTSASAIAAGAASDFAQQQALAAEISATEAANAVATSVLSLATDLISMQAIVAEHIAFN